MSLEKDCLTPQFPSGIFLMRLPKDCSNSILLHKIIYFAPSWNFVCMVSELEKYV